MKKKILILESIDLQGLINVRNIINEDLISNSNFAIKSFECYYEITWKTIKKNAFKIV